MRIRFKPRFSGGLLLWCVVAVLACLLCAAKLISVTPLADQASDAFQRSNAAALSKATSWLAVANWVEPHKALFAAGDAFVVSGDFRNARPAFEAALSRSPEDDSCKVRVNLALTIEKLGDGSVSAGEFAAASGLFREAEAVVAGSAGGCFQAGHAGNADGEGQALEAASVRLAEKLRQAEAGENAEAGDNGQPEEPAPQDDVKENPATRNQLQQLQDSAREAQQDRSDGGHLDEYLDGADSDPPVEKPW